MTVAGRPTITPDRYRARLARAAQTTAEKGFDAVLVAVGPDLRYLTGYEAMPLERLTMLVVAPEADRVALVVPRLEEPAARVGCRPDVRIVTWEETDDPHALVADWSAAGRAMAYYGWASRTSSWRCTCSDSSGPSPARRSNPRRSSCASCG